MTKKNNKRVSMSLYKQMEELTAIGNRGVKEAREENRRLGLPNVFGRDGIIYYELPDGTITTESPFEKK